jgi:mannose-6-phosphate isomerase-like protein (cupin superfamily)
MKTYLRLVLPVLMVMAAPALAVPPAVIFSKADAASALADNHAKGFAMKNLQAVDMPDAHTSTATLRRDKGETSGLSHDHVTEVYEILDGEATLITGGIFTGGGKAINSSADPAIGPSHQGVIEGGKSNVVKPGDMIIIAPGTPHEFARIDDHVTYMVIRFSTEKY